MAARGKLIVIEGIDGSGKRTQLELLARAFEQRGLPYARISFPNYEGFFGQLVARFLNGDFGPLDAVDPHFSALLYSGDRYESKPAMEATLAAGKNLLCDRYIGSNLAHQGARVTPQKRAEFLEWLRNLEYKIYGLPAEDLVIYLRVPVAEADRLIGKRPKRRYTELRRDLQEADKRHLEGAAEVYEELGLQPHWVRIDCADARGALRRPDQIHAEVLGVIGGMMFAPGGLEGLSGRVGE